MYNFKSKFWNWGVKMGHPLERPKFAKLKCCKMRKKSPNLGQDVDNMIIPCYTHVIHRIKLSGLALGVNWDQSDFFAKKGLKAPKSTFKTRYMINNEQILYQHGKKPFWIIGSPKCPLLGPKQPQILFFIENDQ